MKSCWMPTSDFRWGSVCWDIQVFSAGQLFRPEGSSSPPRCTHGESNQGRNSSSISLETRIALGFMKFIVKEGVRWL